MSAWKLQEAATIAQQTTVHHPPTSETIDQLAQQRTEPDQSTRGATFQQRTRNSGPTHGIGGTARGSDASRSVDADLSERRRQSSAIFDKFNSISAGRQQGNSLPTSSCRSSSCSGNSDADDVIAQCDDIRILTSDPLGGGHQFWDQ